MNKVYVEWKNLIKVYMDGFDGNFFDLSKRICSDEDAIEGVMFCRKIEGKEELSRVYYQNREVKKGELSVEILKEIQSINRNRSVEELSRLVNAFNSGGNKMLICSINYNQYEFVFRIKEKFIEIYEGGLRKKVLNGLPGNYTWEGVEKILSTSEPFIKARGEEVSNLATEVRKML